MKIIKLKSLIKEIYNDIDSLESTKNMMDIHIQNMDTFTKSYVECALWSSTDNLEPNGGDSLDKKYTIYDISTETLSKMEHDCKDFEKKYEELYERGGWSDEQAGHDFWLTRNGHGSGFWDRSYGQPEEIKLIGNQLTKAANSYSTFDLYLGDGAYDGLICGG